MKGFAKSVLETNDLAGQRELVAEYLEVEVRGPVLLIMHGLLILLGLVLAVDLKKSTCVMITTTFVMYCRCLVL